MIKKIKLPEFTDYVPHLNMEAVAAAITAPKSERDKERKFSNDDFQNIKEMIWSAAEKWLPRDLHELQIDGVEQESHLTGNRLRAIIDLEGVVVAPTFNALEPYVNKRIIIDWKTRDGTLDQPWRERKIDSWQWRIYAHVRGASIFSYRGVSRRAVDGICEVKEILLGVPESNSREVEEYISALSEQRQSLLKYDVWPRNWDACNDYGRECPFKWDCDNYEMPRFFVPEKELSFTQLERFKRCQEFSRRMIEAPGADDTEDSSVGSAFHSAIAELYSQAILIKEKV